MLPAALLLPVLNLQLQSNYVNLKIQIFKDFEINIFSLNISWMQYEKVKISLVYVQIMQEQNAVSKSIYRFYQFLWRKNYSKILR